MKPRDIGVGILVMLIWGSNYSVIAVGLDALDPFVLTTLRFALTAVPFVFFLPRPRDVPVTAIVVYGVLFGAGIWGVANMAMANDMSPGLSSLVLQFAAFITVVLSAAFFRERVGPAQVAGMLLSIAGLVTVIHAAPGESTASGTLLVLLAALNWSVCNLIVKRYKPKDMVAFIVWTSALAVPALLLLTLLARGPQVFLSLPATITPAAVASLLFQAYVTTVVGYAVWNNLLARYPASSVAPLSLLVPVSGMATSWVAFDEVFPTIVWFGVLMILLGIAVFMAAPLARRPALS